MGGLLRPSANKICRGESQGRAYAFAYCGDAVLGPVFNAFLSRGADPFERPQVAYVGGEKPNMRALTFLGVSSDALEIRIYDEDFLYMPEPAGSFIALGAGDGLAMGAMAMGASAVEAVKVACEHGASSGYPVYWLNVATGEEGVVHG
jgi:hypothetical protein